MAKPAAAPMEIAIKHARRNFLPKTMYPFADGSHERRGSWRIVSANLAKPCSEPNLFRVLPQGTRRAIHSGRAKAAA